MSATILHGDCVAMMRELPEASIDAIVTDPPYGLEFMGKEWDKLDGSRNASRWAGRRTATGKPQRDPAHPGGRSAAIVSTSKPNPRCALCGHYRFSSTPCTCAAPQWEPRRNPQAQAMQDWHEAWAREAFRVLKPGGHLLAFGGTRTYHRMACAIEDAGFEIRDCLQWLYGSGFPKSLDVSKAIDKAAGAERAVIGTYRVAGTAAIDGRQGRASVAAEGRDSCGAVRSLSITAPATPDAERWQGWGTALKPANEPIVLARKPLSEPTVAANVLTHGTGALNVDACRIAANSEELGRKNITGPYTSARTWSVSRTPAQDSTGTVSGRWPANVILSHSLFCTDDACDPSCPVAMLDAQSGHLAGGNHPRVRNTSGYCGGLQQGATGHAGRKLPGGGASRFYYVAKAGRKERRGSKHPTVKPVALMRYLIRMIAPPGGVVLDPFAGSGTTGEAALLEGVDCVLIEREAEYIADIRARLESVAPIETAAD